jgi:hypothetical protein
MLRRRRTAGRNRGGEERKKKHVESPGKIKPRAFAERIHLISTPAGERLMQPNSCVSPGRGWIIQMEQIEEAKRTLEVIGRQWEVALGKLKAFAEGT